MIEAGHERWSLKIGTPLLPFWRKKLAFAGKLYCYFHTHVNAGLKLPPKLKDREGLEWARVTTRGEQQKGRGGPAPLGQMYKHWSSASLTAPSHISTPRFLLLPLGLNFRIYLSLRFCKCSTSMRIWWSLQWPEVPPRQPLLITDMPIQVLIAGRSSATLGPTWRLWRLWRPPSTIGPHQAKVGLGWSAGRRVGERGIIRILTPRLKIICSLARQSINFGRRVGLE